MVLSVAFDWPTENGYDSDHPLAEGEVGRTGIPIDSIEDMQALLKGFRPEEVFLSMTIDATAGILLAFYAVFAKHQGADASILRGEILRDGEDSSRGTIIYPPDASLRIASDLIDWCRRELPQWTFGSFKGEVPPALPVDDNIRMVQTEKLSQLKRNRNPARVDSVLQALNDKAASDENIMPAIVEAVENRCTLGEIADTLREVFGEYKEINR